MPQRRPSTEDLRIIQSYQPKDAEPLSADELVCFEFIGADNLLNRSGGKWHSSALQELADLLPGLSLILDHDWDEAQKAQALIYKAWVQKTDTAPIDLLQAAGNGNYNQMIAQSEGWITTHFDIAIRASAPLVDALRFGEVGKISLGGFDFKDIWCPLCDASYYSDDCPHYVGSSWDGSKDPLYMPYYERKGVTDLCEASIVLCPNLPGAKVVTQ